MKCLKEPNDVIRLLPKNNVDFNSFQLSQFVYTYQKADRVILFNTLTLEIIELTTDEFEAVQNKTLSDEVFSYLMKHHFFVDPNVDEYKKYRNLKQTCRFARQKKSGTASYVILPTTSCNARCFYCFEDFHQTYTLSKEQCEQVIDYILKTKHDGPIKFRWFGGEPMLGQRNIRMICKALKENNVSFQSMMVSNGSLFNPDTIKEAAEDWNLNQLQLTLDGLNETYHQRKYYYNSSIDYFTRIVDNINIFLEQDVSVQIRLNVDWENIDEMMDLIDLLAEKITNKSKCRVYAYPLFSMYEDKNIIAFLKRCFELDSYAAAKGFVPFKDLNLSKFQTNYCCADSSKSIVINATGELFKCEDCIPGTGVGNIVDGITDINKYNEYINPSQPKPECCHCTFLPLCTDVPYCPHRAEYPSCASVMDLRVKEELNNYDTVE